MYRDIEMFLFDVLVAGIKIQKVISEFKNVEELKYDFKSWDSVVREFEIIEEAIKHLINSQILGNEYREIVDFRHLITHNYFGIDEDIIWLIAKEDLPEFLKTIKNITTTIPENKKEELKQAFIKDNKFLDFVVRELEKI
ncbi:HepT-like ribonuclease domain-containing protein [Caminibacter sp.]